MSEAGDANGMATRSLSLADPASLVRVYPAHAQFRMVWFLSKREYWYGAGHGIDNPKEFHKSERKPCLVWQPEDLRDE